MTSYIAHYGNDVSIAYADTYDVRTFTVYRASDGHRVSLMEDSNTGTVTFAIDGVTALVGTPSKSSLDLARAYADAMKESGTYVLKDGRVVLQTACDYCPDSARIHNRTGHYCSDAHARRGAFDSDDYSRFEG